MSASAFLYDSNVWVALAFDAHPAHVTAMEAFGAASKVRPAYFCRLTQLSFLRLASTPAILRIYGVSALTNDDVLRIYDGFVASAAVAYREEPSGIAGLWPRLAGRATASPKVWMDAYLAAFAIADGLTLVTTDHAFHAFERSGLDLEVIETS